MNQITFTTVLFGVSIIPAIVGLVEVLKDAGMPSRLSPAAAVVFGVLFALAEYFASTYAWIEYVVLGVALGLSAVGVHTTAATVGIKSLFAVKNDPSPENPVTRPMP